MVNLSGFGGFLKRNTQKYCKRSKYLLLKDPEKLKTEEKEKLLVILSLSSRIQHAYELKNEFIEIIHSKTSEECKKKLADWIYLAENSNLPEFNACTTALHNWSNSILNAVDCHCDRNIYVGLVAVVPTPYMANESAVIELVVFGFKSLFYEKFL